MIDYGYRPMWPSRSIDQARARLALALARNMDHSTMDINQMDTLIEWKLFKWKARKERAAGGDTMQDQLTIEVRVDFTDPDILPQLQAIACSMARTMMANIQLLGPTCKPECAVFSDNFMNPPEKLDIYADLIGKGKAELDAIKARDNVYNGVTGPVTEAPEEISDELLAAVTGGAK